jgi:hypothetical protein
MAHSQANTRRQELIADEAIFLFRPFCRASWPAAARRQQSTKRHARLQNNSGGTP